MRTHYIIIFLMISSFAKSQDLTCADFKIGSFKIESTNYKLPNSYATRTEKTQKESAKDSEELEGSIEWKSECSYELIYTKASPQMIGRKINVEIKKIEGQKAICVSTCEGLTGIVLEFEMEKIN